MLRPQLHKANLTKLLTGVPSTLGDGHSFMSLQRAPVLRFRRSTSTAGRISASSARNSPLVSAPNENKTISVSAEVTVKLTVGGVLSNIGLSRGLDDIADLFGKSILLELVSSELDPKTGLEKGTIKGFAHKVSEKDGEVKYEATFEVSDDFGEVGGIFVTNEHHKEMHLKAITLTGFPFGPVAFGCNSWVQPKSVSSEKRIFFTNKSYLPSQTPSGLKRLREKELGNLRGNGQGERKASDRIYDYDTYNDLGNPDKSEDLKRPVLGGKEFPYPRRGRTGRPRSKKDPMSETRSGSVYVPRDEAFSEVKGLTFSARTFKSVLHAVVPSLETLLVDKDLGFPIFRAIDSLFDEGLNIPKPKDEGIFKLALPRIIKALEHGEESLMQFELPELLQRDKFAWFKDEEFARQTLAGLNPMSIQLVTEFPIKSKLDPEVYGPADSLITKELIEREIKGIMTLEEAIKAKKVFVIDYHDLFLPYVHKVRAQPGTTLYGSRALFFLTEDNTLRPIAIELTRPKSNTQPQWRQVFTPGYDATSCWLWKIAKAHVVAHDAGYHQLVSHWLRTHCCIEPFIIAANRQLSAMHPIYRLLHPHFRYTMEINALAREALINAGGIIESSFSPLKYSMEISSVIYGKLWRFDKQSLPADLISRGMAVEDPTAEHGLKLAIEDYPYANDGLLMWSAIKDWITEYVSHYYQDASAVASDSELQSWWTEARNKGHPDIKDGWLPLDTPADLVHILSTIIWVASCHHAAVNFGQYSFGGYFPNRPTIARTNVPTEDHEEGSEGYFRFLQRPESALLQSFPSQVQATVVMAILDVLSSHSPDEEYIGDEAEGAWGEDPVVAAAFEKFNGRMKEIEGIIDGRNTDWRLKNRTGAGIVPYNLLKPFSGPGITGRGVPNSISI